MTTPLKVTIEYVNPDKGSYEYINFYHAGCISNIKKLALRLADIKNFDFNNKHHLDTCAWSYFKTLFMGNPLQPIFDTHTIATIRIDGIPAEKHFPTSMQLKGHPNFTYS